MSKNSVCNNFFSCLYLWGTSLLEHKSALCCLSGQLVFMQLSAAPREHTPNHGTKFRVFFSLFLMVVCRSCFYLRTYWNPDLNFHYDLRKLGLKMSDIGFICTDFNCNSAESVWQGFFLMETIFSFMKILLCHFWPNMHLAAVTRMLSSFFEVSCISSCTLNCALVHCSGDRHS